MAGLIAVPVADVLGASQLVQEVMAIGARSLVGLGFLIAASAGTHLIRFGGRQSAMAFASFAAAGASGLLAVAEQFETWFLDTRLSEGLDVWGLAGGVAFFLLGMVLLQHGAWGDPDAEGAPIDG